MSATAEAVHTPSLPAWALYRPFRMSTNQYEKLVDSGVFTKKDKLQLIDGILVAKVTQNPPHSVADLLCGKALARVIPAGWHLRPDKPLRLPPYNEPEPDHCVVRGAERDFLERHPGAADVGLLVEVAASSLAADREMARIFAASGLSIYWIVNLVDRQVEVYTGPGPDGYAARADYLPGMVVPLVIDGATVGGIAVDDVLP